MTKLIALVDGSVYSQSVCDHAAWVAGRTKASVDLLHVLKRRGTSAQSADLSGSIGLGARTALLEELAALDAQKAKLAHKRGRHILDDAKDVLDKAGVGETHTKLRNGDVVETVQECEVDADLIVIGKRGEAADFNKLHLGSNLERIVRASHKPVLVTSRSFKPIERFMIAFDGGESSLKAVQHIAHGELFIGLECHILMVGSERPEKREQLDAAADLLRARGYKVQADLVSGQSDVVISERVDAADIGLLVMGAYGHSRIRNLIIGSTTAEMLRSCKVPVMMFR